jgi:hypothetical protein
MGRDRGPRPRGFLPARKTFDSAAPAQGRCGTAFGRPACQPEAQAGQYPAWRKAIPSTPIIDKLEKAMAQANAPKPEVETE